MNALSPVHKIGKQMEDVYLIHKPGTPKKEIRDRIYELFRVVNLSDRVYELYPHELSGGMMQRISIALSLIMNPKLLVMDEATTALDVVTQNQILREIMQLQNQLHLTRLMITHDVSVVSSTCNKVVVMYAGRIMEKGYVVDVLVNPRHPYTQGLLKSFPSFHGEKTDLRGIPGSFGTARRVRVRPPLPLCDGQMPDTAAAAERRRRQNTEMAGSLPSGRR